MARVTLSGLVSDIRGKVQGSVFQQSQGGLILRSNPGRVNKLSDSQSVMRNWMSFLQQGWRSLTQAQQAQWSNFAKFAPVKQANSQYLNLSGQQLYIKINLYRLIGGQSGLLVPVFAAPVTFPLTATMAINAGDLEITYDRALVPADEYVFVYATDALSPSITNPSGRFRNLNVPTAASATDLITTEYEAVFNRTPAIGDYIFFKVFKGDKDTGIISSSYITSVTLA